LFRSDDEVIPVMKELLEESEEEANHAPDVTTGYVLLHVFGRKKLVG